MRRRFDILIGGHLRDARFQIGRCGLSMIARDDDSRAWRRLDTDYALTPASEGGQPYFFNMRESLADKI
jgi:hypothetical protein